MKRHIVINFLAAKHTDSEIAAFLKVGPSFVYKVQRELGAAKGDVAAVSQRKWHCRRSIIIKTLEFDSSVQAAIDEDPGKSIRANELQVDEATIRRVIHENLRYKSYVMRRIQLCSIGPRLTAWPEPSTFWISSKILRSQDCCGFSQMRRTLFKTRSGAAKMIVGYRKALMRYWRSYIPNFQRQWWFWCY